MSCASARASASSAFRPRVRARVREICVDLQRVGQAAAEVVAGRIAGQAGEDLRLAGQAAKGARVQDAGGVAGKGRAVGMRRLVVGAPGKSPYPSTAIRGGSAAGGLGFAVIMACNRVLVRYPRLG